MTKRETKPKKKGTPPRKKAEPPMAKVPLELQNAKV